MAVDRSHIVKCDNFIAGCNRIHYPRMGDEWVAYEVHGAERFYQTANDDT